LNEIFLHSRSDISIDEFKGYMKACPKNVKLVGIRVRLEENTYKLYRQGISPILRGALRKMSSKSCYFWASGFKPRLNHYDGFDVPIPLRIDIQHGTESIEQVAKDIFGLTKLNYNACRLGSSEPVTIKFSNSVGEILVSNPYTKLRRHQFKYYI